MTGIMADLAQHNAVREFCELFETRVSLAGIGSTMLCSVSEEASPTEPRSSKRVLFSRARCAAT